jgi:hypothetical protein
MALDRTEQQDRQHQQDARARSLEAVPPAQVEGYLLENHLGAGAFGQVWLATDRSTGRKVAIKFYNRRSVGDIEPLAREVQKLVVLSADRHVVQLLDIGWEADPPYFVMEYLSRGSLEDLLRRQQTLPVDQALEVFEEVAAGLMHLHGKGILHCDLKPGNVLLDNDNKPRLADFGQSRLSDDATPSLGTLFYMALEQADLDATPDAKWDVYALGALLYVMLTGKPPYFDNTLTTEIEASGDVRSRLATYRKSILSAGPPRRHRQIPGVDRALADIIERCIAIDPRKRYSSVQSVLLALRQRREAIARRPLMLLGLVGPLLLGAIATLFGWTAFRRAVYDTDHAVTARAMESNLFAARLAARSAAEQMDQYFRIIEQLAVDRDLVRDLQAVLADEALSGLRRKLSDPARNVDESLNAERGELRSHPVRVALESVLRSRAREQPLTQIKSWWVYDLQGNQLANEFGVSSRPASAVPGEKRTETIGLNYSWRTYFTGLERDLYRDVPGGPSEYLVAADPDQRQHIQRSNLSAVFSSQADKAWKIAFSTPVRADGKIIGLVGLTVEMGNFVDFDAGASQYALMYDSRPGERQGIILEHPLLDRQREQAKVDDDVIECRIGKPPEAGVLFNDPIGTTAAGVEFRRPSLASEAKVEFTEVEVDATTGAHRGQLRDSGLRIVVLEDYASVIEPAHTLGQRLSRLGLFAALLLAVVALVMWLLVVRLMRQSSRQLARSFTSAGSTSPTSSLGSHSAGSGAPVHKTTQAIDKTELG